MKKLIVLRKIESLLALATLVEDKLFDTEGNVGFFTRVLECCGSSAYSSGLFAAIVSSTSLQLITSEHTVDLQNYPIFLTNAYFSNIASGIATVYSSEQLDYIIDSIINNLDSFVDKHVRFTRVVLMSYIIGERTDRERMRESEFKIVKEYITSSDKRDIVFSLRFITKFHSKAIKKSQETYLEYSHLYTARIVVSYVKRGTQYEKRFVNFVDKKLAAGLIEHLFVSSKETFRECAETLIRILLEKKSFIKTITRELATNVRSQEYYKNFFRNNTVGHEKIKFLFEISMLYEKRGEQLLTKLNDALNKNSYNTATMKKTLERLYESERANYKGKKEGEVVKHFTEPVNTIKKEIAEIETFLKKKSVADRKRIVNSFNKDINFCIESLKALQKDRKNDDQSSDDSSSDSSSGDDDNSNDSDSSDSE